jgi:hypothetical protein
LLTYGPRASRLRRQARDARTGEGVAKEEGLPGAGLPVFAGCHRNWRYEIERESAINVRRERMFV